MSDVRLKEKFNLIVLHRVGEHNHPSFRARLPGLLSVSVALNNTGDLLQSTNEGKKCSFEKTDIRMQPKQIPPNRMCECED